MSLKDDVLRNCPIEVGEVYRNLKGLPVKVLHIAESLDDGDIQVVYCHRESTTFCRSLKNFISNFTTDDGLNLNTLKGLKFRQGDYVIDKWGNIYLVNKICPWFNEIKLTLVKIFSGSVCNSTSAFQPKFWNDVNTTRRVYYDKDEWYSSEINPVENAKIVLATELEPISALKFEDYIAQMFEACSVEVQNRLSACVEPTDGSLLEVFNSLKEIK